MRSQFVEKFNHNEDATSYDKDVLNESDPIRAGYDALLNWVAAEANALPNRTILELGAGTGNLTKRLTEYRKVVCVDVSKKMTAIGEQKLSSSENVEWIHADLLEYFDQSAGPFDAIISTYAIHHLTELEKEMLFQYAHDALSINGIAVFGDLMFENIHARERILEAYRVGNQAELANDIEDEFFWDVEHACNGLSGSGFRNIKTKRFSELSRGIICNKL